MNEQKHTSGPWRNHGREVRGAGSWTIAQAFHTPDGAVVANARLIAAAPEMLAALEAQEERVQRGILNMTEAEIERVHELRRTAIAKATGQ